MGAARPVTNESSLPKEMEGEKEERANKEKIRASRLTCMAVSSLKGQQPWAFHWSPQCALSWPREAVHVRRGSIALIFEHSIIVSKPIWTLFSNNQDSEMREEEKSKPGTSQGLSPWQDREQGASTFHSLSLSWRGAITAKLTEAKEDAVTGNVFVPKIPHWLSKRERTERMPAQGPDVAPWGDVVPCSLSIGWDPAIKASASSRCGQKGTFQRSWLSKQTWLKQQNLQEEKQGWL